jgi:hypothetical protein
MDESGKKHIISNVIEKQYKTKDYVRWASNKYRQKKYNEDKEYRKDKIAKSMLNYEKNKDKIKDKYKNNVETKERRKLYMREYRAKKKAEKLLSAKQQSGNESASNVIVPNTLGK